MWTTLAASQWPQIPTTYFADNFNGTAINPVKWNTSLSTSGNRWCSSVINNFYDPGEWIDPATAVCQGVTQAAPDGAIAVGGGVATFSSSAPYTFPYIWRGAPTRPSPFPSTGDFTFTTRIRYTSLAGNGAGVNVLSWSNTSPTGDNPSSGQMWILGIWGDTGHGGPWLIWGGSAVTLNIAPNAYHQYQLKNTTGMYSLTVDGVSVV